MESQQQKADCPYCRTKDVAFTIKCYGEEHSGSYVGLTRWVSLTDTFAVCGRCGRGVVMTFVNDGRKSSSVRIAPSPPEPPEHLPENIRKIFQQGMNNVSENFDAAGAMFRKALDVALKNKFPEIKGKLYQRIQKAAQNHKLTPELALWADQVRVEGNEASHGEQPFTERDAQSLFDFTRLVLVYLFSLPGMLAEAQKIDKAAGNGKKIIAPKRAAAPEIKPLRGGIGPG